MNEAKSTTVFEERDQLRRECNRLSDQCDWLNRKLVVADAELEAAQKERDDWRTEARARAVTIAELEAARKVADAAVVGRIVWNAHRKIGAITPVDYEAKAELLWALESARDAVNAAVREYRKLMEGENADLQRSK